MPQKIHNITYNCVVIRLSIFANKSYSADKIRSNKFLLIVNGTLQKF